MPAAESGGYLPPKKDKNKNKSSGGSRGSSTPAPSSSSSSYSDTPRGYGSTPASSPAAPKYTPPPSYSQPKPAAPKVSKPKAPKLDFNFDFKNLTSIIPFAPKEDKPEPNPLNYFQKQLGSGKTGENAQTLETLLGGGSPEIPDKLQEYLSSLVSSDKAPKGYVPGAEDMGPQDFAWVPDRFKYRKNGRLKYYWDEDYINASREDFTFPSQFQSFLNDMMEKQFADREQWLLHKNERRYNKISTVLDDAQQAAYDGDYNYLEEYMRAHPNFNLDTESYRENFGVTPEQIKNHWFEIRDTIKDPYMRGALASRMHKMMDHYEKLRSGEFFSYQQTTNLVNRAIKKYEKKYNEDVEFGLNSNDVDRQTAARRAGPAIPEAPSVSATDQAFYDAAATRAMPEHIKKARQHALKVLGLDELPSVRQMLAYKVANGELNPDDEAAVEQEITRLRNPNHPDTRAMYVAVAMQKNPDFDAQGVGLNYINGPVLEYQKQLQQSQIEANKSRANEVENPIDFFGAVVGATPFNGATVIDADPQRGIGVYGTSDNPGVLNGNQLGWTFDKLARLSYGVAGSANAYYGLNKDAPSQSWADTFGNSAVSSVDPLNGLMTTLTGQSYYDSMDEILANPVESAGEVADAGYQQVFRGSGLPGTSDDLVPITFSQVIANNAARDSEHNIYDESWYQHIAGFGLDVGLDPLNFVGVGVVDDTLKVPARVAKSLAESAKSSEPAVQTINFLKGLNAKGLSPIVEKAWRVNETLLRFGDDVNGKALVEDFDLWKATDDPAVAPLTEEVRKLKVQEAQLKNDVGIQVLEDELSSLTDEGILLNLGGRTDLRMNKLMQSTSYRMKEFGLENPGGRFWRDYIDPFHQTARSQGFTKFTYADNPMGQAAQKAQDEIDKIWDDISAGNLHETDPAVVNRLASLNKTIDDNYDSIHKTTDFDAYMAAGAPGFKPAFDPVNAFAKAAGITKEEFLKTFSREDVHNALINGSRMLVESDPVAAQQYREAWERISNAKEQLADPNITAEKRAAVYKAKQIGYTLSSNVTLAGALRYLDVLKDMRRAGSTTGARMSLLEAEARQIDNQIDELVESEGLYSDLATGDLGDYYGGFEQGRDKTFTSRVNDKGERITDTTYGRTEDETQMLGKSQSPALAKLEELQARKDEIQGEIESLRLQDTTEVTGFPPAKAYEVNRILPSTSVLRKSNGDIDIEKVKRSLEFDPINHKITYKAPEGATAAEHEFLNIIKDTVQYEYYGAYRGIKSEIYWEKHVKPEGPGPNETALGLKPTSKSLAEEHPHMYDSMVKDSKQGGPRESISIKGINDGKPLFEDETIVIKDAGGAKGMAPKREVFVEHNASWEGGRRTRGQNDWAQYVQRKQKRWEFDVAHARRLDAMQGKYAADFAAFKISPEEQQLVTQKAYKKAEEGVLESVTEGSIKQVPGNMRLTINEQSHAITKQINLEAKAKDIELKIKELEATNADELRTIRAKRKAVEKKRKAQIAEVEKARTKAIESKKIMEHRVGEEEVLQIAALPVRATGRMLHLRVMGLRKNLQFTNSLFRGAENAAKLVPAKFRENFANYMVRPTKQLDTHEAIYFRAMWESKTPVIIKAHLSRMSDRMRHVREVDRAAIMKSYRTGVEYEGPAMQYASGINAELRGVEDIFNGTDELYHFRKLKSTNAPVALTAYEINKFLPTDYQLSLRSLNRTLSTKGEVKVDDIIQAVKDNGGKVQDLLDPFRFSWVMRLAADQARQYRAVQHSIEQTFGVAFPKEKQALANMLRDKHGWQTHAGLSDQYLFPPEAANDIEKLLKFMEPGPERTSFGKMVDTALGYWKQSMTIYNPGYYTRNGVGEILASWLDGVNHPKWYRMATRVHRYAKGSDLDHAELIKKWSVLEGKIPVDVAKPGEVLFSLKGGQKVTVEDVMRTYENMGLKSTFANTDLDRGVRSLAGSTLTDSRVRKGARAINSAVHDAGEGFEDWLRMAHFMHAMEHSGKRTIKEASYYAAQRVTKYHFDYTDFSQFEKTWMLRAFPFYKWTRRGAPLMLAHLFLTPGKMVALPKAMDAMSGLGFDPLGLITDDPVFSTQDVHQDKNGYLPDYTGIAPGWVRDLFAYQMGPAEDDEYANYFRIQTPQIDGLNAMLGLTPGSGNDSLGEIFGDSAGYPLLNPALKAGIELGTNQSMDPDFPYEIYGGDYNERNGISPFESILGYAARSTNPFAGFLAKLSKNGDLGPLSMGEGDYKDDHGYDVERDILSFLTGAGFYQGKPEELPPPPTIDEVNPRAVGLGDLPMISAIRGRKPAGNKPDSASDGSGGKYNLNDILKASGAPYSDGSGSGNGWIDYPNYNYGGYGGYGGYNSSGGSGYSSVGDISGLGSSFSFYELIQRLRALVDQGQVYDE